MARLLREQLAHELALRKQAALETLVVLISFGEVQHSLYVTRCIVINMITPSGEPIAGFRTASVVRVAFQSEKKRVLSLRHDLFVAIQSPWREVLLGDQDEDDGSSRSDEERRVVLCSVCEIVDPLQHMSPELREHALQVSGEERAKWQSLRQQQARQQAVELPSE